MNEPKNKTDEFLYSIWNFFAASLSEKTRKNYYNVIKAYTKQKIIIFNGTDAYVRNAYVMRIYTCT